MMKFGLFSIGLQVFVALVSIFIMMTQTYLRQPVKLFLWLFLLIAVTSIIIDVVNLKRTNV
ncbi:hypothetical protein [Leuconostoc gelidum]|uniref:hypothetical protein n=1 Tax=Leuconostoc gelidum TaxID=1244 RepID=UPI001CC65370|nr:hypothetical protein [Leuconostoc gelidum]